MTKEIEGLSIVLIGDFNPKIFQPAWFAAQELIRTKESEESEVQLITPEVTSFKLGDWLELQVTRERFSASTAQEAYFEILRDLVLGTFTLLRHSPVRAVGINYMAHHRLRSEEEMHSYGYSWAPKTNWEGILNNPGMRVLIMQGKRTDGYMGYVQVQSEPSAKVQPGIFFAINDHFQIAKSDSEQIGCLEAIEILRSKCQESIAGSRTMIEKLLHPKD